MYSPFSIQVPTPHTLFLIIFRNLDTLGSLLKFFVFLDLSRCASLWPKMTQLPPSWQPTRNISCLLLFRRPMEHYASITCNFSPLVIIWLNFYSPFLYSSRSGSTSSINFRLWSTPSTTQTTPTSVYPTIKNTKTLRGVIHSMLWEIWSDLKNNSELNYPTTETPPRSWPLSAIYDV